MKYLILLLSVFALNATATDELGSTRKDIAVDLSKTVKKLKTDFKLIDDDLKTSSTDIKKSKKDAEALKKKSEALESNPTVLDHGEKSIPSCSDNLELYWNKELKRWDCQAPEYGTDCIAASDEYRYETDGKTVCTKNAKGSSIDYYWKYRGLSLSCGSNKRKKKIYGCYYTNKLSKEVEVSRDKCINEPSTEGDICYADWKIGSYGSCSKSCGGGTQTRSITCETNHECRGAKPATSQSCNTQQCVSPWSTTEWGSCENNKICYECGSFKDGREMCCRDNYEQKRSVSCPAGFSCTGSKPSTVQRCTPKSKWCGKACEG